MTPRSATTHPLFPARSRRFERFGWEMSYVDEGSGPPVVFVHGNPTWSFYWRALVMALAPEHRCIAPDHLGFGRSDQPPGHAYPFTLTRRIEDFTALLDHLQLERVDLVVHDWGGAIGMGWAVRHPDRVRRLVVMNTAAFGLPPGIRMPRALTLARTPLLGSLLVRGANAFVHGAIATSVRRRRLDPAVAEAYRAPLRTREGRLAVHRFVLDIPLDPQHPSYTALQAITEGLPRLAAKPMLLAWGMKDFVFHDAFLDAWVERFPHAEVHRFDDCGHWILEDAPQEVAALVRPFLAPDPEGAP